MTPLTAQGKRRRLFDDIAALAKRIDELQGWPDADIAMNMSAVRLAVRQIGVGNTYARQHMAKVSAALDQMEHNRASRMIGAR
jgi:hypothetical protein